MPTFHQVNYLSEIINDTFKITHPCFVMKILLALIVSFIYDFSVAQHLDLYKTETYYTSKAILPYRMLMPEKFDSTSSYPLLIFLHGAYEKGSDNQIQLEIGGKYFLRENIRDSFPAIVIFPQCPIYDVWAYFETTKDSATGALKDIFFPFNKQPTNISAALMSLIDSLAGLHYINAKRIYIAGLSQGAMGVLDLIARYPDTFAAALSICGAGNTSTTKRFAGKVSLWLFHGNKDDILPVSFSRDFYRRLVKEKADVKYSEYKGVYHNSWINAFNEPGLMSWLFSKSKK